MCEFIVSQILALSKSINMFTYVSGTVFATVSMSVSEALRPLETRPGRERQTKFHLPPTSSVPPTVTLGDLWHTSRSTSCLVLVLSMMCDLSMILSRYFL